MPCCARHSTKPETLFLPSIHEWILFFIPLKEALKLWAQLRGQVVLPCQPTELCLRGSLGNGAVKVKVAQSCTTLCDPMDYTVHGILQARILEWVAFPFSRGSSQPRDQTQASCIAGGFFTS